MSKQKTQIAKTGNSGSSKFNRSLDQEYKIAAIDKIQAIAEFDMSGNILSANQNFLDIVGYNLEEIQGQHHSIFVEDSYKNTKEYSNFWKNLREGSFSSGEYKRIDKNGREVWIQGFYSSILNSEKKPVKVIKYATNITEQKLRNLEYSAQITAINKSLAVTEFDMSGNILDANQNFLDIIGYTLKEIQGKSHSMFLDDDYANSREYREFWDGLRAGIFNSGQYKRIGKGSKEIWLQSSYNPIFDDNHHPYKIIKYSLDLTEEIKAKIEERKKSEDELIAINNQLEFQNQLKSSVEEIANIVRGELSIEL